MASLSEVTTPDEHGDLTVTEGWRQGRGAYGGLVVGAMIRAIERRVADPARTVRTVTAELPGPLELGTSRIETALLRAGSSMSTARAQIAQGGEVKAHAVALLSKPRRGAGPLAWQELARPEVPPWSQVPVSPIGQGPGSWPEFAQHFEFRLVEGLPFAGGAARIVGWVRPRDPGERRDAAYIASVIDAWYPAALVRFAEMRPIATIAFTLDIVTGLAGLDPQAPLLYRAVAPVLGDGYFLETRELWGEDGRLVAINQQTFAVIA